MMYSQDLDLGGERVGYQASASAQTAALPVSLWFILRQISDSRVLMILKVWMYLLSAHASLYVKSRQNHSIIWPEHIWHDDCRPRFAHLMGESFTPILMQAIAEEEEHLKDHLINAIADGQSDQGSRNVQKGAALQIASASSCHSQDAFFEELLLLPPPVMRRRLFLSLDPLLPRTIYQAMHKK